LGVSRWSGYRWRWRFNQRSVNPPIAVYSVIRYRRVVKHGNLWHIKQGRIARGNISNSLVFNPG
jgi:hypothetical protein